MHIRSTFTIGPHLCFGSSMLSEKGILLTFNPNHNPYPNPNPGKIRKRCFYTEGKGNLGGAPNVN